MAVPQDIRSRMEAGLDQMADLLGELVQMESPSGDVKALDKVAARLETLFGEFGPITSHRIGPGGARHLVLDLDDVDAPDLPHTVVLGHYDTVWAMGTLARMPFRIDENGIVTGPGCFDMKGGLVQLYFALRELRALGRRPRRRLRVLITCDEEVGSPTSRELIHTTANGAAVAYVLESPLAGGALKTARKGISTYRLVIEGRAAHAGIEPEKGASAIVELAHQVHALHALSDRDRGTSVNVGVVSGGSRPNVVAAHAEAEIDVRVATVGEAERVGAAITGLRPALVGTSLSVTTEQSRPPMEPTAESQRLFGQARDIAARAGIPDLRDGSTGGASDANLVAVMGIPTLDGLGPEGGGAHADDEHVVLASMPARTALIAGLLADI